MTGSAAVCCHLPALCAQLPCCETCSYARLCFVHAEGRKISVTDLGSTNGTYLDEEELPPNRAADLYVGSKIVFGKLPSVTGQHNATPCTLHIT